MDKRVGIIKNIEHNKEEISQTIDLLSQKDFGINDLKYYISQKPIESAIFAFLSGFVAAVITTKFKSIFKLIMFVYSAKQAMSYFNKREVCKNNSVSDN